MKEIAHAVLALNWWPFAVLLISAGVVVLLSLLRVPAFFVLILAALAAGLLAGKFDPTTLPESIQANSHWVQILKLIALEMGQAAANFGVTIALVVIIGVCFIESGAVSSLARRFLALFGEKRAADALMAGGYLLTVPAGFSALFTLLLPFARALGRRPGRDYGLYVLALCCGGAIVSSLAALHSGPIAMAETLELNFGLALAAGLVAGIIPAAASWLVARQLIHRLNIPKRDAGVFGADELQATDESQPPPFALALLPILLPILLLTAGSIAALIQGRAFVLADIRDAGSLTARIDHARDPAAGFVRVHLTDTTRMQMGGHGGNPPSVSVQKAMIKDFNRIIRTVPLYEAEAFKSVTLRAETRALAGKALDGDNFTRFNRLLLEDAFAAELKPTHGLNPTLSRYLAFVGDRNMALLIGALLAAALVARRRGVSLPALYRRVRAPLAAAVVMILIACAAAALGAVLQRAGIAESVQAAVVNRRISLLLLAWALAAILRVAQGSLSVALLTTAAMVYPVFSLSPWPYHSIYLFLAIGFGGMFGSWMNDSTFWIVSRVGGFTEKETLQTWTLISSVGSVVGLLQTILCAKLLPMV
jgi:gluconate:H+ symporter, GntP family